MMEYDVCYPNEYKTYTPWNSDKFGLIYGMVKKHTLVSKDRCYVLYQFAKHCMGLEGDYGECGVYKGGTAKLIAAAMGENKGMKKKLYLWDTFEGMPDITDKDKCPEKKGYYGDVVYSAVTMYLRQYGFVRTNKGFIPNTFEGYEKKKFAFVHVDVDLYETTKECFEFFYGRMVSGGIMICDDYGFEGYKESAKKAVDRFFSSKKEVPVVLKTGQCLVVKI